MNRYYYSMSLNKRAMPAVNADAEFALIYDVEFALIYDGFFDVSALKVDGSFVLL